MPMPHMELQILLNGLKTKNIPNLTKMISTGKHVLFDFKLDGI